MKISIVTAYHNRKQLFINTLNTIISQTYNSELEIVVVDDNSNEDNKLDEIIKLFPSLDIKILRIEDGEKLWVNPCIPFNIGFKQATGDVIIIQNPECLHLGEIIKTIEENIEENKYLVFGCYAVNINETNNINNLSYDVNYINNIREIIHPIINRGAFDAGSSSWYQHSIYRSDSLHFCTAITKKDLDDLGGFDERFANGIAKDDREFIIRIKRKGMNIIQLNEPFSVHQRHKPTSYGDAKLVSNNNIMYEVMKKEEGYRVNR